MWCVFLLTMICFNPSGKPDINRAKVVGLRNVSDPQSDEVVLRVDSVIHHEHEVYDI